MKSVTIFLALFLVSDVLSLDFNKINILTKRKRQADEKWIWGVDDAANNTSSTSSPTSGIILKTGEEINPCNETAPPTPDFSASGKRIAEQKCEEYIWNVKLRLEETKRNEACEKYKDKHGISYTKHYVVGGKPAKEREYTHMGAIGWKAAAGTWLFKCGSSLISSKFALTAAHCAKASNRDTEIVDPIPKIVRFGQNDIKYVGVDRDIVKIITHPKYKSPTKYFDIALMELDPDLSFTKDKVQPACIWHDSDNKPFGTKATTTGWGVLQPWSREISTVLQVAEVQIIDPLVCDALLRPKCNRMWCGIQDTQICAGNLTGGVDTCQGDSGGPLQVQIPLSSIDKRPMYYIIGVTSFGFGCAKENTPGVYTRVQPFLDWIESIVWK